jgi:hypothetical protein
MSDPISRTEFARVLRTSEWWAKDRATFQAQLSEYDGIPLANMPPATAAQIGALALAKTAHLYEIVEALALDRRPGRPKGSSAERTPRERTLSVSADPGSGQVEVLGMTVPADQARELGHLVLHAADVAEGKE